jgi:hypothetical protein
MRGTVIDEEPDRRKFALMMLDRNDITPENDEAEVDLSQYSPLIQLTAIMPLFEGFRDHLDVTDVGLVRTPSHQLSLCVKTSNIRRSTVFTSFLSARDTNVEDDSSVEEVGGPSPNISASRTEAMDKGGIAQTSRRWTREVCKENSCQSSNVGHS